MKKYFSFLLMISFLSAFSQQKNTAIFPGKIWKDISGNAINAHGGSILYFNKTYYWFGEIKKGK
ncbi:MAG TPA: hypothetical protein VIH86_13795, partial [Puia sp.]